MRHRFIVSPLALALLWLAGLSTNGAVTLAPAGASAQTESGIASCAPNCSVWMPAIQRGQTASLDLQPASIELTQGIQSTSDSVPLIAGRLALARVTVTLSGAAQPVAGVSGQLHAFRSNVELASSPLSASFTAPLAPNRLSLTDTLNFWLPADWTSAPVDLYVQLNPAQSVAEADYSNDRWPAAGYLTANFRATNPLNIVVVPISAVFGGISTFPASPYTYVTPFIWETYPISQYTLSVHAPMAYTGATYPPSANDWTAMLSAISSLHNAEDPNTPDKEYLGVVSVPCSSGCIAGIGWVNSGAGAPKSWFSAVAFDGSGDTSRAGSIVAHEIGHTLGRTHAPDCGGQPYDTSYPNSSGVLDDIGFNFQTMALYNATSYRDFMSYCSPVWTSKYGFETIFTFRNGGVAAAVAQTPSDVYSISGSVDGTQVRVLPPMRTTAAATPDEPQGEYRLELRDAGDRLLQAHAFSLHPSDHSSAGFQLNVPADERVRRLSIYRGARLIFDQQGSADLRVNLHGPLATDPSQLSWDATGAARYMVRASSDGGATWQVLGLNLSQQQLRLDLQAVAGGGVTFEVQASDGVRVASDRKLVRVSKHAPRVSIVGGTGRTLKAGEPIALSAIAHDPEDGALGGASVVWRSDRDGVLGTGTTLWLDHGLSAGTRTITVSASDADGNTSLDSITLNVQ